jgi:bifunctional oligoribonuclease and PAP phosphatase NrnA
MRTPEKVLGLFKDEEQFLIAAHINPDGDAIGSALALSFALESMGKETFIYDRDPVPEIYKFLPGHDRFRSDLTNDLSVKPVLVLLDCNSLARASLEGYAFRHSLVIDHHETEADFGDTRWIDQHAAATGLMVYFAIKSLGLPVTKDMAINLYTAISVDTGTFRYSNTTAEVLRVSADLVKSGAEPNHIADNLYETWDRRRFNLFVMALNTLEIKGDTAIIHVTKDMFRKTGTKAEDTENFANFPRMMQSMRISVLLRELGDDEWKASLRSRDDVNVARVAELFGGGGHRNAAGFKLKADLGSAKKALLRAIKKFT